MSAFITSHEVGKPDITERADVINFASENQTPRMLKVFGFDGELLRDQVIARAAAASRSYLGGLFPPSAPGSIRWIHTVEALREALIPHGYEPDDSDQLAKATHHERRIAILPATGSSATGLPFHVTGKVPTTKYSRGQRTVAAIEQNIQLPLFDTGKAERAPVIAHHLETWMLLQRATADEVRSELSLPASIDPRGFITSWKMRFILPPHSNEGGPIDQPFDDEGDDAIDVIVEPK
jgi:hypothetical protein